MNKIIILTSTALFLMFLVSNCRSVKEQQTSIKKYGNIKSNQQRNPIGYLNDKRKEYSFDVYPMESVNIKPQFNTPVAHATIISANGQMVGVIRQNGIMFSRKNNTASIVKYKLVTNALRGNETWPSNVSMIEERPGFGKIGWAENYSMNYNDATVEVTIFPPLSHPGPFPIESNNL